MYAPPEAPDHPLLEGQYIGFYRLECDDNHPVEVCTPHLVRLVKGKLQTIFSVETDIQDIGMQDVEGDFRHTLMKHGITSIISPTFFGEEFFGFSRLINLDSKERQKEPGYDEVKNWVEYGGIYDKVQGEPSIAMCEELGITLRGYDVERKEFFERPD